MKILLTGRNGQLGWALQRSLAPLGELVALGHDECDLVDVPALRACLRRVAPDVIVNAAAYTAVDKAETETDLAHKVNAIAPGVIGEEARRLDAAVVHYSSDYVFDGTQAAPYVEDDPTHPLSAYGRSKRDGELALEASGARHLIFRSSWVVGAHGNNFAKTILRLAAERDRLGVVADQFGVPTPATLLARITAELLARVSGDASADFPYGLYHLVPSGRTCWHEYACLVVAQALRAGRTLKLTPERIQAIGTADYPLPAARPANSCLDTSRLRRTFDLTLPDWQSGVLETLDEILHTQ